MNAAEIIRSITAVVGGKQVLTQRRKTSYYRSGFRSGNGEAAAVVFPTSLLQQWQVLQICVKGKCAIIMQAAKTGLTEGSCPSGDDYGRPVVIINTTRLKGIHLLAGGKQVLALPGATLHELENLLRPIGRAPHSVIGSTGIGATVIGGVANNAGGALCKRGSSYTELSLFARVDERGELQLVNHLGIRGLGDTPEEILKRLEQGGIDDTDLEAWDTPASDRHYGERIRDMHSGTPNRFNADPRRLFEVSGSAGKVAAFAVRVDSYPLPKEQKVFYLGANNPRHFTQLRKDVLMHFKHLPEMCEYMNRDIFDVAARYGKDVFLSIKHLGTKRLPAAYALKSAVEYPLNRIPFLPKFLPDIFLHFVSRLFPNHLSERLLDYRDRFQYYLILKMADEGIGEVRKYLESCCQSGDIDYFECSDEEERDVLLHRFAAAGAAIRYQNLHQNRTEEVLALDIALRGDDPDWVEQLPEEISQHLVMALYYGHFMCHVFHQDYIFKKGTDIEAVKTEMVKRLEAKGAKLPAEHNVGHMYKAEPVLRQFYEKLDPTNTFNAGIGKQSKQAKPSPSR